MNHFRHVYNSGHGQYHVQPRESDKESYDLHRRGYPHRDRQMPSRYNQAARESVYNAGSYDPRERNAYFPQGSYSIDFERETPWNSNEGNYENRMSMKNHRDYRNSERGYEISERGRNSQRGYGTSERDRISQRGYGILGRGIDSQRGFGIPEGDRDLSRGYDMVDRGRNLQRGLGISKRGHSNYFERETYGSKRPYWKAHGPEEPYYLGNVASEPTYNRPENGSDQVFDESLRKGTHSHNSQRQLGEDTVQNQTFPRGSSLKKSPKSATLKYPEIKASTAQEVLKTNYVKKTADRESSGNSGKTTGNVQKQNLSTYKKSKRSPLSIANMKDKRLTSKTDKPDLAYGQMGLDTHEKDDKQSVESTIKNKNVSGPDRRWDFIQINDTIPIDIAGTHPNKLMEASSTEVTVIEAGAKDEISLESGKTLSSGEPKNEIEHLEGLSALTLASCYDEDVRTKSIARAVREDEASGDDCIVENLVSKTSSAQVTAVGCSTAKRPVTIKDQLQTKEGPVTINEQISSAQRANVHYDSDLTSGQTLKSHSATENADFEMKDDGIYEIDNKGSQCNSLTLPTVKSNNSSKIYLNEKKESGSIKAKTSNSSSEESLGRSVDNLCVIGSDNTMLSGTLYKTESRKGGKVDSVQDNVSVEPGYRTPGNSVQDSGQFSSERKGKERTPTSDSKYGTKDRQRMQSGESQRFPTKERLGEGKRRHSEEPQYGRESYLLQHRSSIDSSSQDKRGVMQRSQSDNSQEITPKTAQTYREYREAKQRQLEREERERKRNQMRSTSIERHNGHSTPRKDSMKNLDDVATPSNPLNKGGQASSSISTISDSLESKFCIVYGADLPSPQETSDRLSDFDIDLDDSDDELLETPSFLKDLETAITQPVPGTPPPKNQSSPGPGSPIPMANTNSIFIPSTSRFAKFSLDSLLAEHTDKPEEQREFEEMQTELKESVRKGGFVKDTLEKQEDHTEQNLLPEHQEQIEHLEMKKSVISTAHPGETIFCPNRYKQLYTSRISPTMCGFTAGESFIDKFLTTVQPKDFDTLLSSEVLVSSLEKVSCPKILLKWLIFLLSVDESHLVMDGCYKVLEEYLYCHKVFNDDQDNPWAPSIEDLLSVFMNCGASEESILPKDVFKGDEEISTLGSKVTRENNQPLPPPNVGSFNRENLRMVIQVIALALQRRPKYQTSHLLALYVMLCRVALDKSLNCGLINIEIQSCLGSILCCYSDSEWKTCALQLSSVLPTLTDHHHNKAYLASLSPYGRRGQFLQRRVAYIMLRQLFDLEPCSTEKLENCKIRDLHQFLPHLQNLVNTDMYKLYSCIMLIDLCVGNGLITPAEKDSLQYLSEQIKKICGDTRDDVRMLDRSRVKDQMVRLTSKWTLMLLTVGSKQRSIFAYTSSRAPQSLTIETVQTTQSDESQSEEDSNESQSEQGSDEDMDPLEDIDLDPTEMQADDVPTETPADKVPSEIPASDT
ncbi:SMC5-SMC6 complex localization factor protein 2-like [Saccostrea echinata]|uniref:SMC5-SMC6 complex localization factor protein 2-like n=1 Tax=Saccostrea echinata TaxID=191078 RepID=UPI002A80DCBF|nr:SMC5-SMC6 complex localization factor protein 2-like [Saccostrea echinata]